MVMDVLRMNVTQMMLLETVTTQTSKLAWIVCWTQRWQSEAVKAHCKLHRLAFVKASAVALHSQSRAAQSSRKAMSPNPARVDPTALGALLGMNVAGLVNVCSESARAFV
jgi:hypothetical protein